MKKCPACHAELPAGAITCAFCGSSVVLAALSPSQRTAIQVQAVIWNGLLASRIRRITWSVGAVTSLVVLLTAAFVYTLTLVMGFNLSWSLSLGITLLLMIVFFAALIRNQLGYRSAAGLYQRDISLQIQELSNEKQVPRWQLELILRDSLSEGDPLRQFMPSPQK